MTRRLVLAALILVLLVVISTLARRNTASAEETVRAWLLCDECSDGELSDVLALGRNAIPLLTGALRSGPDAQQRANVRTQLEADVAAANRVSGQVVGVSAIDTSGFYGRYIDSYVRTYQERALIALNALRDTAAARHALDSLVALDGVTALGWDSTFRAAVQGHRTRVTEIDILPIADLVVGQSREVKVRIVGGDPNAPLAWSSRYPDTATVAPTRVVTGHGKGRTTVRACSVPADGSEPICDVATVTVRN
jgi:hypothetical protein